MSASGTKFIEYTEELLPKCILAVIDDIWYPEDDDEGGDDPTPTPDPDDPEGGGDDPTPTPDPVDGGETDPTDPVDGGGE